jgi:hypothetical protein
MKKVFQMILAFVVSLATCLAIMLAIAPEFGTFLVESFTNSPEIAKTFANNLDKFKYDKYSRLKGSWRLDVGEKLNIENQDVETIIINDEMNAVTFITKQGELIAPLTYFDNKTIKVQLSNGFN